MKEPRSTRLSIARVLHTGLFESEHRLVLPYGKTRWVIVRGRCLEDEHGNLLELIGVTIDVSAQKQSDLQLQIQREEMSHLNRVALMGEMTASVAHELNQPLTAIANNAAAARRFLERGNIDPVLLQQLLAGHGVPTVSAPAKSFAAFARWCGKIRHRPQRAQSQRRHRGYVAAGQFRHRAA